MQSDTGFENTVQFGPSDDVALTAAPGLVLPLVSFPLVGPFDTVDEVIITLFAVVVLAIGLALLYLALKEFYRTLGLAVNRPIAATEVADTSGSVELEGTAQLLDESDDGGTIAYKRERQEKETTRDSDGNKEEEWKTVSSSEGASPFKLTDETGSVVVDPEGANLSIDMDRTSSSSRRRTYRGSISPDDTVHIYGQKLSADDVEDPPGNAEFFVGDGGGKFLLSDTTQFRTVLRYFLSGTRWFVVALITLMIGVLIGFVALDAVLVINPIGG